MGTECYLEKRGSRKIFGPISKSRSRFSDGCRSLVFRWFLRLGEYNFLFFWDFQICRIFCFRLVFRSRIFQSARVQLIEVGSVDFDSKTRLNSTWRASASFHWRFTLICAIISWLIFRLFESPLVTTRRVFISQPRKVSISPSYTPRQELGLLFSFLGRMPCSLSRLV